MIEAARKLWREFADEGPGQRFTRYHERRREPGKPAWRRLARSAGGALLLLAGLFFMPAPGPGIVIFAFGAAVLAGESIVVARLMDRLELRVRKLLGRRRKN